MSATKRCHNHARDLELVALSRGVQQKGMSKISVNNISQSLRRNRDVRD
jgi:hypothetical protein